MVTYDERKMKFRFQFSLTRGISSILVSDDEQEVVGDLVTERPLVRKCCTGGFEERVKCVTLFVNGEGEVGDVEKLGGGRDVLVEIMEQKRLCVFRLMSCTRDGSAKEKQGKVESVPAHHLGCDRTHMGFGYTLGGGRVEGGRVRRGETIGRDCAAEPLQP